MLISFMIIANLMRQLLIHSDVSNMYVGARSVHTKALRHASLVQLLILIEHPYI